MKPAFFVVNFNSLPLARVKIFFKGLHFISQI